MTTAEEKIELIKEALRETSKKELLLSFLKGFIPLLIIGLTIGYINSKATSCDITITDGPYELHAYNQTVDQANDIMRQEEQREQQQYKTTPSYLVDNNTTPQFALIGNIPITKANIEANCSVRPELIWPRIKQKWRLS